MATQHTTPPKTPARTPGSRPKFLGRAVGPRLVIVGLFLLGGLPAGKVASAQSSGERPSASSRRIGEAGREGAENARRRGLPRVTPEREAAALTFVRQHHPELVELLMSLRENSPRTYQRAVAELFRTSERLAQIQERQPDRYALELELWKTQSRVHLIAARLTMDDDPQLRQRLRETLARQVQVKRQLLTLERDRLQARLEKLDSQVRKLEADQDQFIEQQIQQLTRSAKRAQGRTRAAKTRGSSGATRSATSPRGKVEPDS